MKVAFISDIHSNFHALHAVYKHAIGENCERFYCAGDVGGYGPKPHECWRGVKKFCTAILKGNHEDCIATPSREKEMNRYAIEGARFSRKNLPDDVINEMRVLPVRISVDDLDLTICHGSYSDPSSWNYIDSEDMAAKEVEQIPTRFCIVGHTHNPFVFGSKEGLYEFIPNDMVLDPEEKYIINVGSVGQPRDGDCRACYCVLDYEFEDKKIIKVTFNLHRVFYNILETDKEMAEAGISTFLSDRLYRGE